MTDFQFGLTMFGVLFALIALRMPIPVAMALVGGIGFAELSSFDALMQFVKSSAVGKTASYTLSVIPLFILMGHLATKAGLSKSLFDFARHWGGHVRGGLAMATIVACAAFGAICGSSLATGATMTRVALPEMQQSRYSNSLAGGALAAGGTLGILIPPSIILVIYAVITEQSIGKLFLAAILPGVLAVTGYMIAITAYVTIRPSAAPKGPRSGWPERFRSLWSIWVVIGLFAIVVGGIYLGAFTPTEGAAVGVFVTMLVALAKRRLSLADLKEALLATATTTGLIMLILVAAEIYNSFLAMSGLPTGIAEYLGTWQVSPYAMLAGILLVYLLLGCVMDSISMILLTIPVFFPLVMSLDIGLSQEALAVWFGILALMVVEIGLITPPIGLNVFIIAAAAPNVSVKDAFIGVLPFLVSDLFRVVMIVAFPAIALWLPHLM